MSKPTLYFHPGSPPSRFTLLVVKALALDLDIKLLDLVTGEQLQPWFVAINPQHCVPTLVVDGRPLWDSHAIATYLADKYGGADNSLYPRDLFVRAQINQRLQFNTASLYSNLATIIDDVFYYGATEPTPQQIAGVNKAYAILEEYLAAGKYVVGDHLTLADFAIVSSVTQTNYHLPMDATKYPRTAAWIGRLEELPYFGELNTQNLASFSTVMDALVQKNAEKKK